MSRLASLPAEKCFVTTLAEALWQRSGGDPLALASMRLYLPTRRACRVLQDAFLRTGANRAALLPQIVPLGDVDEAELDFADPAFENLPPAITPLRRQLLLARLIVQKDKNLPWDQAVRLADALAALLDQMQTESLEAGALQNLVPEELARHWQETLVFLEILKNQWPALLKAEGCMDGAARRVAALDALTQSWREAPPSFPVMIAGSTGSVPAVGRLMGVVARLPLGEVVLPALDLEMDEEAWQAIEETHPQFTMKSWLEGEGFSRADVAPWPSEPSLAPRGRLLREAMRPAAVSDGWRALGPEELPEAATQGLELLELDHQREEADVIALRLRAALEEEGKTAALVTPDRALAARVASALRRWGIEVDDSAGCALKETAGGGFFLALLEAAAPQARAADFLALLKHPLAAAGLSLAACRQKARRAELLLWRGTARSGGLCRAAQALCAQEGELALWLEGIGKDFESWSGAGEKSVAEHLAHHRALAEKMAGTDTQEGKERLWSGADGEAIALWLDDLARAAGGMPALDFAGYARLFGVLSEKVSVRKAAGLHPRLDLLGPLEARLLHHDLVVLGGLNEGVWPPAPPVDPWLSRPMKRSLGLPTPEKRVGLSAHDFVFLASGAQVLMTRARRIGGAPTVPSRFLSSLGAALLAARGTADLAPSLPWRAWAAQLDAPQIYAPMAPPCPRPPVAARPRRLSVTEIGLWQRNPYAIYAKRILKLRKLDPLDAEISAADKGEAIHSALEAFIGLTQNHWPQDPLALLLEQGRKAFAAFEDRPQVAAFWAPRFERIARWFVALEGERREKGYRPCVVEFQGKVLLADGHFELLGRADRVDRRPDGTLEIIDYKTGGVPSQKEVYAGYEPQLPLLALVVAKEVGALSYWQLGGGQPAGKETRFEGKIEAMTERAREGLEAMIALFDDPETPYEAVPKARLAPRYDDYAHLARLAEWGRQEEDGA